MKRASLAAITVSLIVLSTIVVYSADAAGIPKKAISLASRFIESDLPVATVFTDQANTFSAGLKQIFQASSTTAGIGITGVSSDPSGLSAGDVWFNSGSTNALKFSATGGTQTIVAYTGACGNNQILVYSTGTNTWSCTTQSSGGITSIDGQSGPSISLNRGSVTNMSSVINGSNTISYQLKNNIVQTNGSKQTISKTLNIKGGDFTTSTCPNGQTLKYQSSNSTWICSTFISSAVTSINTDSTAAQFFNQVAGNTTITNQGTGQHTIDIGSNVVTTVGNNGRQTFQKGLDFGAGQTDYFGNTGIIVRNPATTFATTLAGGAVTANRTLDLPVITGTDTLVTLGLSQTFTQNNNFSNTLFAKGLSIATVKKTATYTATATDDVIDVNATNANPTTINLPDATTVKGKIYWIKKDDTSGNTVIIDPSGSQTIGGNTTLSIFNNGGTMTIQSDGSNWLRIDRTSDDINSFRTSGSTQNRWYGAGTMTYTATTLTAVATLNAYPFVVPKTITIDQEEFEVTTLGSSSACRQGIYTDNGNQQPDVLVSNSDSGSVATTATGVKTTTFASPITLYGGNMYWLAISCKATLPTLRAIPVAALPNILGMVSTMGAVETATGYTATYTCCTNALPSPYGTSPTINSAVTSVPELLVRIKG